MEKNIFTPFIQTHTFNVEPYLPITQGYAPFLVSTSFNGLEKVTFNSINEPAISYQLNEYSRGKWYLNDEERIRTATGRSLKAGEYEFIIDMSQGQRKKLIFRYEPSFIGCSDEITFQEFDTGCIVSWVPPQDADSFWVFFIPSESKNFFEDLIPITENQFKETQVNIDSSKIPSGYYKCVIRTNRAWKHSAINGFLSESWSISDLVIYVP